MILTDERAVRAVKAALRWMKAHHVEWLKTEEKVYSKAYDFAGTMDGLAYVDSCSDPACCTEEFKHSLCLIDFKTSNQLKDEYCLQTAAYQQALHEEHGTIIDNRWLLRLGKNEEEAGKFETWRLPAGTFAEDLSGFIACLNLVRLTESISERMKNQKSKIHAVKKEQKETAKALAKEQEKLQKALDKASAKKAKEEEKVRIKAEAKAERERLKAEKKGTPCTSTEKSPESLSSDTTLPAQPAKDMTGFPNQTTAPVETPLPERITSTEVQEYPSLTEEVKAILEPAHVQRYKEVEPLPYKLPME